MGCAGGGGFSVNRENTGEKKRPHRSDITYKCKL